MKVNVTKISIVLSLLGFTTASYADDYLTGWNIKAGVNYQQFSNNGSTFAESQSNYNYNITPDYHLGYNLGAGYHIPGKDSDINLDYTQLHGSDTNSVWGTGLSLFGGTTSPIGSVTWASGTTTYDYNSLDLTAGHKVKLSPTFGLNYYGGLNYSSIAKNSTVHGTAPGVDIWNDFGTTYSGFGPTFGLEGDCYPLTTYPEFSVSGGVKTSMLYGRMTGYVRTNENNTLVSESIPNEKTIVPAVGGNLGLNYGWQYPGVKLETQLGYQLTEYFGATKDVNYNNTASNASFQGPFFNVNFRF